MDAINTGDKSSKRSASRLLVTQILTAVAEVDDRSVDELDPLYDVIDPEALDALFAPRVDGSSRSVGEVSFRYAGYWVTVTSKGAVKVGSESDRYDDRVP